MRKPCRFIHSPFPTKAHVAKLKMIQKHLFKLSDVRLKKSHAGKYEFKRPEPPTESLYTDPTSEFFPAVAKVQL